nr:VCBS domain-containing protein [Shewanella sp. Isolate11]
MLNIVDLDAGEAQLVSQVGAVGSGGYGEFQVSPAGGWIYTADNSNTAIQTLAKGDLLTDTLTVHSVDGTAHDITVTIEGTNDAAKISGVSVGIVVEDNVLSATGQLQVSDVDAGEAAFTAGTIPGAFGSLDIDSTGGWTYTSYNADTAIQQLGEGEKLTDSITVQSIDGTSQTIHLIITGSNDAPTVNAQVHDFGSMYDTQIISFLDNDLLSKIGAADVDVNDQLSITSVDIDPAYGSFSVDQNGYWTLTTVPGVTQDDVPITIQVSDGITQTTANAIIDIQPTPMITIESVDNALTDQMVTTGGHPQHGSHFPGHSANWQTSSYQISSGEITVVGSVVGVADGEQITINIQDALNPGTTSALNTTVSGGKWSLTIDHNDLHFTPGAHNWQVDAITHDQSGNSLSTSTQLTATAGLTETVDEGSSQVIDLIAGTAGLVAGGLSYSLDGTHFSSQAPNGFVLSADGKTLLVDADSPQFNQLAVGDSQQIFLRYDVNGVANGQLESMERTAEITITGTNDAPVISGLRSRSTQEDGKILTGQINATDPDGDRVTLIASKVDGFTLHPDGSWSFDPSHATYQSLPEGTPLPITVTITATDSHGDSTTQNLDINLTGTNDAAVIGGVSTANVTEDTKSITFGNLSITDADTGESQFKAEAYQTSLGGFGEFEVMSSGFWIYTLDNTNPAIQALAEGETLIDTFEATALDGTKQLLEVTITGTNDAPTVSHALTDQTIDEDSAFSFTVPADTFADLDTSDSLTLTATGLPAWLSFDQKTGTFSGTPDNADVGTTAIRVTATDGQGALVSSTFNLVVNNVNDAPVLNPISQVTVTEDGQHATGTITATDADTGDVLTYAIANPVAGLTFNADGNWMFDPSDAAYQSLPDGQTQTLTIPVTVTDSGNLTAQQDLVINLTGTNDVAKIAGVDVGSVKEEGPLEASGTLTVSDLDSGENRFISNTVLGAHGTLTINGAGSWRYSINNADTDVQQLGEGDSLTDTLTVKSVDGTTHDITITIEGTNDAPTVSHALTVKTIDEDTSFSFTVPADTFADLDASDSLTLSVTSAPTWVNFDASTSTLSGTPPKDYVGTETITVTASDGHGGTTFSTFNLVVNNVNDAPVLDPINSVSAVEDGGLLSGDIKATDVDDASSTLLYSGGSNGGLVIGGFSIDQNGHWTFDPSHSDYQYLKDGELLPLSIPITVTDPTGDTDTQMLVINLTGTNDAPVITGLDQVLLIEDTKIVNPDLLVTAGRLAITDEDKGEALFKAVPDTTSDKGYGTFSVKDSGDWWYAADNANPAIQALAAGKTLTDSFTMTSADGTQHTITITIEGTNDKAQISGTDTGTVTEDSGVSGTGKLTTSGDLSIIDVDKGEAQLMSQIDAAGSGGYGLFQISPAGHWSYSADNSNPTIQALNTGESLTDTLTVKSVDGTTHDITVTIQGTDDGVPAVIGGDTSADVTEDTNPLGSDMLEVTGQLTITDPNPGEDKFIAHLGANALQGKFGSLEIHEDGNWTYSADNTQTAIQDMDKGAASHEYFTVKSVDGTTQVIKIDILGVDEIYARPQIQIDVDLANPLVVQNHNVPTKQELLTNYLDTLLAPATATATATAQTLVGGASDNAETLHYTSLTSDLDLKRGDDQLLIDGNIESDLKTGEGHDIVVIKGDVLSKTQLENDDDVMVVGQIQSNPSGPVIGQISAQIDGGGGTDVVILQGFTKAEFMSQPGITIDGHGEVKLNGNSIIKDVESIVGSDGQMIFGPEPAWLQSPPVVTEYHYAMHWDTTINDPNEHLKSIKFDTMVTGMTLKDHNGNVIPQDPDGNWYVPLNGDGTADAVVVSNTPIMFSINSLVEFYNQHTGVTTNTAFLQDNSEYYCSQTDASGVTNVIINNPSGLPPAPPVQHDMPDENVVDEVSLIAQDDAPADTADSEQAVAQADDQAVAQADDQFVPQADDQANAQSDAQAVAQADDQANAQSDAQAVAQADAQADTADSEQAVAQADDQAADVVSTAVSDPQADQVASSPVDHYLQMVGLTPQQVGSTDTGSSAADLPEVQTSASNDVDADMLDVSQVDHFDNPLTDDDDKTDAVDDLAHIDDAADNLDTGLNDDDLLHNALNDMHNQV